MQIIHQCANSGHSGVAADLQKKRGAIPLVGCASDTEVAADGDIPALLNSDVCSTDNQVSGDVHWHCPRTRNHAVVKVASTAEGQIVVTGAFGPESIALIVDRAANRCGIKHSQLLRALGTDGIAEDVQRNS